MAVLGISPGTRTCGFAVIRDGDIKTSGVKSYKEKWNEGKLIGILYSLSQLIHRHKIQKVAIKIPDDVSRSKEYTQLIGAMNALFEQRGISARYFTLSEIKRQYGQKKKDNKKVLFEQIVSVYPGLKPLYQAEIKAAKPYYDKVFEAVGAADCFRHRK